MELAFGIVLLILAVALVVAVSLQSGKEKGMSGTIAGGMDTGFGGKGSKAERDRKLSLLTTVVSVVFVLIVVVMYIVVS